MSNPNIPIVNAGIKYVNGLRANIIPVTKTIQLTAGAARDNRDENDIIIGGSLITPVNQFVTINAAVVGLPNGLDAGVLAANTNYYIYAIGDSTGNNPAAGLVSLNFLLPILPVGYDVFRRVGVCRTDATPNFLECYQYGVSQDRTYYYDVAINVLTAGAATAFTTVDLSVAMPSVALDNANEVLFKITYTAASAGNFAEFRPVGSTAASGNVFFGTGVAGIQRGMIITPTLSRQIQYKVTNAGDSLTLDLVGFKDYLSTPQ